MLSSTRKVVHKRNLFHFSNTADSDLDVIASEIDVTVFESTDLHDLRSPILNHLAPKLGEQGLELWFDGLTCEASTDGDGPTGHEACRYSRLEDCIAVDCSISAPGDDAGTARILTGPRLFGNYAVVYESSTGPTVSGAVATMTRNTYLLHREPVSGDTKEPIDYEKANEVYLAHLPKPPALTFDALPTCTGG